MKPYGSKYDVDFWENMKIYFRLLSKYKLLVFLGILVITLMELATLGEKFIFKAVIDNAEKFSSGSIGQAALMSALGTLVLFFAIILVTRVVGAWSRMEITNRLDSRTIKDMKQRFFDHLIYLSHKFHSDSKTGSLISRMIRGSYSIERITDVLVFSIVPLIIRFSAVAISFAYFSLKTGIVLIITSILFISYSIWVQRKQEKPQVIANKTEDREKANISDIFSNVDTVKYFGKEKQVIAKYSRLSNRTKNNFLKFWGYFSWMGAGQQLILGIGTFFMFYFPIMAFIEGTLTVGTLAFIYTTYVAFVGLLFQFVHGIRGFRRAVVDFNDLFRYAKIENDIKDVRGAKNINITKGKISFRNVDFSYEKERVIKDFNLTIPANSKVAIVGPSGSGKSTIVKLLFRLYDLDRGSIYIDDQDISKVKQESLRSEMSIVPQDAVLFDDTIYNNIKFSNPKATREEVFRAIKFAQLDELIKRLPLKENTIVGERGVKLSGGERQRVSIARAVLANKKVLVLDEATSALDSQIEAEIQAAMNSLTKGRTSIIIAHRLSTIMSADIIIVVDKGKIVEAGTHGELLNRGSGLYKKLWSLQAGSFESNE